MIWMLEGFVLIILKCACSLVVVTEGSGRFFFSSFLINTLKKTFMTTAICFYCAIFLFLNQTIRLTRLENASYIKAFDITKHPPHLSRLLSTVRIHCGLNVLNYCTKWRSGLFEDFSTAHHHSLMCFFKQFYSI